jgi:Flp pilus assembly protein TadG
MSSRTRRHNKTLIEWIAGNEANEIVEFAVSVPLLLVFVVGIYDFGSAFTLKEKIGNIAREGARFASNLPSTDLSSSGAPCTAPASVCSVRDLVNANLVANRLNPCALSSAVPTPGATPLSWNFATTSPANGCPNGLTLTIERGITYTATISTLPTTHPYTVEASRVTIQYPYAWTFNRVITLIASGTNYPGTSELTEVATMQNLN